MTTQPNDKHREAARAIIQPAIDCDFCIVCPDDGARMQDEIATALATTEAEAYARGRAEAKAEDAGIARKDAYSRCMEMPGGRDCGDIIADAILASSPGPVLEERVRAEIADAIGILPRLNYNDFHLRMTSKNDGEYLNRDDVLAAIAQKRDR